ncbi:hypothetical protein P43SY_005257 [Pythium insidiosum]|uniref:Inositol 2-dehydrogenase n=1 Tax=Pythium insidiosum TaxID=114742 RepID=A0AAD5LLK1_PYTIN|nr:hypothetical protein P43SY_005257 [Pythium insidiosum]
MRRSFRTSRHLHRGFSTGGAGIRSVRLGILGAGRIGRVHAASLSRLGADLRWVSDPKPHAVSQVAHQYSIPNWTTDSNELIAASDVDAVVICSPTPRHAEQIVAAARHGKHIFCEKPVDLSLDIVNHAIAEVERAGVKMMVGFNRRFDANFQRIRQAIVSGEIGTVTMVRITSRDPSPPPIEYVQASGGMFKDMTIHDFDMARFLVGDDVDEVYAMTQSRHAEIAAVGDIDTAVCLLKFKSGVIAYIENSRDAAYGYDQRVEVLGSLGSVSCDNVFSNNVVVSTRDSVRRDLPLHFFLERYMDAVRRDLPLHFFLERYMDAYVSEMESFLRVVSGSSDEEMPVGGVDGREALLLAVAAEKSRLENRPIKLNEFHH